MHLHVRHWSTGCVIDPIITTYVERGARKRQYSQRSKAQRGAASVMCRKEHLLEALDTLDRCFLWDPHIFANLLQGCINMNALAEGRRVHLHLSQSGFDQSIFLGNKLINMYAKCGSLIDAREAFGKMTLRNVISWTSIIAGYAHHGLGDEAFSLFQEMRKEGISPNRVTFLCVLSACNSPKDLENGKMVHFDIVKAGTELNIMIGTGLIDMYGKCGSVDDSCQVFSKMHIRDVVSWTAMITVYAQHGHNKEALELFQCMQSEGFHPNEFTLSSILGVCDNLGELTHGKQIHMFIVASQFETGGFVGAALVSMYAKCGSIKDAHKVFSNITKRDVVSWTAMITGCAQHGCAKEMHELFQQMQLERFEPEVTVGNALVDLYTKSGSINDAHRVFDKMPKQDIISWSMLISGYVQQGCSKEALELYWQMQVQGIMPDKFTVSSILGACASIAALTQGKQVHTYIIQSGLDSDVFVGNALVNMYAKCGVMEDARIVLDMMSERDVISWNAMIAGHNQHGCGREAFDVFQRVLEEGLKPDEATFSSVLSACATLGMLVEGKEVHAYVMRNGFEACVMIGNALVDVYAKCGSIEDAHKVFTKMSTKDAISWSSMIAAYAQHGHGMQALKLLQQMQQESIKPDEFIFSSILYACSHAGLIEEGCYYFVFMSREHVIIPVLEHYASMVDLLGRSGCLYEAEDFIYRMPIRPNAVVWMSLLGGCCRHGNVELAERAAKHVFNLEPENVGAYIILSNIYAASGRWNEQAKVMKLMMEKDIEKELEYS